MGNAASKSTSHTSTDNHKRTGKDPSESLLGASSSSITPIRTHTSTLSEDPRSPSCKRTPLHSPISSAAANVLCGTPTSGLLRGVLQKYSPNPLDPRSPASLRTPISHTTSRGSAYATPPPFKLSMCMGMQDPRSPLAFRTPLNMTQEDVSAPTLTDVFVLESTTPTAPTSIPADVTITTTTHTTSPMRHSDVIVCKDGAAEYEVKAPTDADTHILPTTYTTSPMRQSVGLASILASSVGATPTSPLPLSHSSTLFALAMSPLPSPYSPSLGARKRRTENMHTQASNPSLKKSFGNATDENTAPPQSPTQSLRKSTTTTTHTTATPARAPLSPLTPRSVPANTHAHAPTHTHAHARPHYASAQPIKFRMDATGIAG